MSAQLPARALGAAREVLHDELRSDLPLRSALAALDRAQAWTAVPRSTWPAGLTPATVALALTLLRLAGRLARDPGAVAPLVHQALTLATDSEGTVRHGRLSVYR